MPDKYNQAFKNLITDPSPMSHVQKLPTIAEVTNWPNISGQEKAPRALVSQ
jgi:hypothetical protein